MNHRGPPDAEPAGTLALFPSEAAWARTRVLDAQAVDTCDFDLDRKYKNPWGQAVGPSSF